MFEITSRELRTIEPYEAADLLKKNTYRSQRALNKEHVINLCNSIQSGSFHIGNICVALSGEDEHEYLLNGQHQLHACVVTSTPITVSFMEAYCHTATDMADLFAQFDVHPTRSIAAIVNAEINAIGVDWHYKTGSLVASALALILQTRKNETKRDKAARLSVYKNEGHFVNQFMTSENAHLMRVPVVAAIIATYWRNDALAYQFWVAVANGEYLKKTDPRLRLRTYLFTISLDRAGVSRKEVRAKCHTAWNAWMRGESTALKYYADKSIPLLLK